MSDSESGMPATNNRHASCDEILPLIPAYAIGATDPADTALVEAALPHCADAQLELDLYRVMADDMRASVPQIEPPAALKSRLIAATQTAAFTPALAQPALVPPATARPARRIHPAWAALAAAVLLLIATNVFWLLRSNVSSQDVIFLTQDITWTRLENEVGTNAWALMMWNPSGEGAVLCAYNFPELESGKTYQLWLRNEDGSVSGGTFHVNERGFGLLRVRAGQSIDGFEFAGITTEPYGSTAPTGDPVVRGEV